MNNHESKKSERASYVRPNDVDQAHQERVRLLVEQGDNLVKTGDNPYGIFTDADLLDAGTKLYQKGKSGAYEAILHELEGRPKVQEFMRYGQSQSLEDYFASGEVTTSRYPKGLTKKDSTLYERFAIEQIDKEKKTQQGGKVTHQQRKDYTDYFWQMFNISEKFRLKRESPLKLLHQLRDLDDKYPDLPEEFYEPIRELEIDLELVS